MTYTCGLCGKPGEAEYESDMVHNIDRWVSILHCNRCADFRSMLRKLRENCKRLTVLRWQLQKFGKMTEDRETTIRTQLASLTKAISQLVCTHWRVAIVWEPDFVNQMLNFPDKTEFIVNHYAEMIKVSARATYKRALNES